MRYERMRSHDLRRIITVPAETNSLYFATERARALPSFKRGFKVF